jgi:class 3 adenylate cyclase
MGAAGWLTVGLGSSSERSVPIDGRLFVGRECSGIEERRRLIIEDGSVSRDHLEIRCRPGEPATLTDHSTNGTLVNGRRVERGEAIDLHDGDEIAIGNVRLRFRAADALRTGSPGGPSAGATIRATAVSTLAVVVGDIVGYTGMTERYGGLAVARATEPLFEDLHHLVAAYGGTVLNYAGDAILAGWDAERDPDAAGNAVRFALAAEPLVRARGAEADLRTAAGGPLRMGWAVTLGEAALARPTRGRAEIHGDCVTLAFRAAGLAAREGRGAVLVTAAAARAAAGAAAFGPEQEVTPRGHITPVSLRVARTAAGGQPEAAVPVQGGGR